MTDLCRQHHVSFYFGEKQISPCIENMDIVIIANGIKGIHELEELKIANQFQFETFPEYLTLGVAAITYKPSTTFKKGYHKERINSKDQDFKWGFKSTIVGEGVVSQAKRFSQIKPTDKKFTDIQQNPALVWQLYGLREPVKTNFSFLESYDFISQFEVIPSISRNGVILYKGKPLILWGDARCGSHPLTGSGLSTPFLSAKSLLNFVDHFAGEEVYLELYNEQTLPLVLELFTKALIVTRF